MSIRVLNSLDPDQTQHSVGPDLDPNCLQKQMTEVTTSKQNMENPLSIFFIKHPSNPPY